MNDLAVCLSLAEPEQARLWDSEARELAIQLGQAEKAWARLGMICALMERHSGWKHLDQHSFGSWMLELERVSGRSRKTAYAYRSLWLELEGKVSQQDMEDMNLTAAHVVKQLPRALQRDPDIIELAKQPRCKQLREHLAKDHPEAHVELEEVIELHFSLSAAAKFKQKIGLYRRICAEPEATYEEAVENIFVEWSQSYDERD